MADCSEDQGVPHSRACVVIGRVYLERGEPVTVLARWAAPVAATAPDWIKWHRSPRSAPRNVLIERADKSRAVRPFRGLRKIARPCGTRRLKADRRGR